MKTKRNQEFRKSINKNAAIISKDILPPINTPQKA
jgi:hypothetical protein